MHCQWSFYFIFLNSPTVINQEPIQILSVHGADVMRHRNLCISLFVFIFRRIPAAQFILGVIYVE